ncbi:MULTISPECIES: hypothetical protein [Pseudomonas]|uniref:hypothetical protein n=1 Tax=Pseudomonas TaxID=286 RepID=UPI001C0A91DC|nr:MULTISPECIES: hypothetical protein [Pseudomonas]MCK3839901.1 hypothetical protein [Pseudomonas sp. NCIMB 10586]VCU63577.1 hypothetical protein [Pseudomonas synxantha]
MNLCLTFTEVQWGLTKDVAAAVGSLASLGAVAAAIVFGILGLKTWRRQLQGTTSHELSRKLLVAIYTFEATLNAARDIGLSLDELDDEDISKITKLTGDTRRFAFTYSIYRARLKSIESSLVLVRAHLFEARALWGAELEALVGELMKMKDEWWTVARRYSSAMNPEEDSETRERYAKAWIQHKGVLYEGDQDNEYWQRFQGHLFNIEAYLRTKL